MKVSKSVSGSFTTLSFGQHKIRYETWPQDNLRDIYLYCPGRKLAVANGEAHIEDIDDFCEFIIKRLETCSTKSDFTNLLEDAILKFKTGEYYAI